MTTWRPDPALLKRPMYLSLCEQIVEAIEHGVLGPGQQLPPQRELAEDVGVSLQTVSRAYEELRRRDLVQGEIGRGTFIQARRRAEETPFREYRQQSIVDLSIFKPVTGAPHKERMAETLAEIGADVPDDVLFSFRPNEGLARHIDASLGWLARCGVEADPDRVVITNGVTQGITTALLTVSEPGGVIAAEAVGHHSLSSLCAYLGMRVKGLPIDEEGIIPDGLDRACREGGVRAVYLMPNLAGPTVALMSEERRRAIVEIARARDVSIIENDVIAPLNPRKAPTLTSLAPERSFYLTGFTKCIMPGLRTGYMVIPPGMLPGVRNRVLATNWMATPLMAEVATRWVVDGTARELVRWQRRALHERFMAASRILYKLRYNSHPHAMHLWLPLTGMWRSSNFVVQAQKQGVAVAPSAPFVVDLDTDVPAVRVSVGSATLPEMKRGLRVLAQMLKREPEIVVESF